MPPDTTKAQFQEMPRNLITERFGLQNHAGKKEITGYALEIGEGGPRLKAPADQSDAARARLARPTGMGKDGFQVYLPVAGKMMMTEQMADRSRIVAQQESIQELVRNLSSQLKTVITDATGLTAKYDFTLTYESLEPAPAPAHKLEGLEPLPDISGALQSQLGLKLERKSARVEIFVVDHMEKVPTGN